MRGKFLAIVGLLLIGALAMPSGAAQAPVPKITITLEWEMDHAEMYLDETGKGDMVVITKVQGEDFVCSQDLKFKVELKIKDSFGKVYGASMVPKSVPTNAFFTFPAGKPGLKPGDKATGSANTEGKLNLAWDMEGVPMKDAKQEYIVTAETPKKESGTCTPDPPFEIKPTKPMLMRMNDRVPDVNGTVASDKCLENPGLPGCAASTQGANDGGTAPGPDLLILLLGLVGLVGIYRRNRK